MNNTIKIVHLYPDLLNLYGDKGNIMSLRKRLEWRGFSSEVEEYTTDCQKLDLSDCDILFLGGGADREEMMVLKKLSSVEGQIADYVENGGVMLAVCGGFPMLGKTVGFGKTAMDGLGILDIETTDLKDRLIGDVILHCELLDCNIAGFENHSKRVDIKGHTPFGSVINGFGNDGKSEFEGVVYKNIVATYLHGPILPKNPKLADYILKKALTKKFSDFKDLETLDDTLEIMANEYMVNRFKK